MKIALLLLIFGVLVSGCIDEEKTTFTTLEDIAMDQLDVYGELLDYTLEGDLATLKIQQEIGDCEINSTYLEVIVNVSRFDGSSESWIECNNQQFDPLFVITNISDLETGREYYLRSTCHKIIGVYTGDELVEVIGEEWEHLNSTENRYILSTEVQPNSSSGDTITSEELFESANLVWTFSDIPRAEKYSFSLFKQPEDEVWELAAISRNLTKYMQDCL